MEERNRRYLHAPKFRIKSAALFIRRVAAVVLLCSLEYYWVAKSPHQCVLLFQELRDNQWRIETFIEMAQRCLTMNH